MLPTRSVGGDVETFAYDAIGRLATHADALGTFTRGYLGETAQLTGQSNGVVGTTWRYDTNQGDRKLIGIANTPGASSYTFKNAVEGDILQIVDSYDSQTLTVPPELDERPRSVDSTSGASYAYALRQGGRHHSLPGI